MYKEFLVSGENEYPEKVRIAMAEIKLFRKHNVFAILLSAVSTLALCGSAVISADSIVGGNLFLVGPLIRLFNLAFTALPDADLLGITVFVALYILYRHYFSLRKGGKIPGSKLFFALSLLFALFILFGMSFHTFGSLIFLLQSKIQVVYAFLLLMGLTTLFYVVCSFLLRVLIQNPKQAKRNRLAYLFLDTRPILIPFLFLLLCWLPYWVACFPGSVSYDMNHQWGTFLGYIPVSGVHPILSTLFFGGYLQVLRIFFNDTICLALLTFTQFVVMAAVITYALHSMRRWSVSQNLRLVVLFFFALNPLIPIWLQLMVKDCIYYGLFLAFAVTLLNFILAVHYRQPIGKALFWTILWGILTSLMRNNGVYIIIPSLLGVLFVAKGKKQKMVIGTSAFLTALTFALITNGLMDFYGATKGPVVEMLSVPFQQTARYVRQYGAELTPEERSSLNTVLNVDSLSQVYDPNISDPVKNARVQGYEAHLDEYFSTWAKMFCKHPLVYLEATLHNTYAYLSPTVDSPVGIIAAISIDSNPCQVLDTKYALPDSARTLCLSILLGTKRIPAVGLLLRIGIYTWALLFLAVLGVYCKKYYLLLGCLPAVMNLLVCISSPVNGYYRYALPHMLFIPVLLGWIVTELCRPQEEKSK